MMTFLLVIAVLFLIVCLAAVLSVRVVQQYESGVPSRAIPAARRKRILGHEWRSRDDAVDLVRALERGQLDAGGGG